VKVSIGNVVATRVLLLRHSDGTEEAITVEIGVPKPDPDQTPTVIGVVRSGLVEGTGSSQPLSLAWTRCRLLH
jgi:hypothetical protein